MKGEESQGSTTSWKPSGETGPEWSHAAARLAGGDGSFPGRPWGLAHSRSTGRARATTGLELNQDRTEGALKKMSSDHSGHCPINRSKKWGGNLERIRKSRRVSKTREAHSFFFGFFYVYNHYLKMMMALCLPF